MTGISRRDFVAGLGLGGVALALAGCGATQDSASGDSAATTAAAPERATVRVASLKGPTSIGLVDLIDKAKAGDLDNDYEFTVAGTADEITPKVIQGEVDVALLPANAASVLYNKTSGAVRCLDVNTLGVLYVVTGDASVAGFDDLAGRTVYMTGKGATPEYAMNYLLGEAGIADAVTLEFKSEAAEVVSALAADATAVGVLPEPYKTAALAKNDALKAPVSLTDVWDEFAGETGSRLLAGVTIARTEFVEEHGTAVTEFLSAHRASVDAVNADPAGFAQKVVDLGIVDSAAVAEKAIPGCNLVCLTDDEMKDALSGYLGVLCDADASSVGGALPADDFYYRTQGA